MSCSTVEISFPDAERQQLFCSGTELQKRFGTALSEMICCRLQFLKWAKSLSLLPAEMPIGLRREGSGAFYSIALGRSSRLIFEALDHAALPLGEADVSHVQSVRILRVANSHSIEGI